MTAPTPQEAHHRLRRELSATGLHLHYTRQSATPYWRTVSSNTKLCGTGECFKLKLRNLQPEPTTEDRTTPYGPPACTNKYHTI